MTTYKTAAIAKLLNVHPNTVRLYEKWRLIPPAKRLPNGYRIFTDFHLAQGRLVRLAFQVEVLQNGLRKKIIQMLHTSAAGNFDEAIALTLAYLKQLQQEQQNAEEAIQIVKQLLVRQSKTNACQLKRKEAAKFAGHAPQLGNERFAQCETPCQRLPRLHRPGYTAFESNPFPALRRLLPGVNPAAAAKIGPKSGRRYSSGAEHPQTGR